MTDRAEARPMTIVVNDRMQRGHRYELVEPAGSRFATTFRRELMPQEMLEPGVFGVKHMTDCGANSPQTGSSPRSWRRVPAIDAQFLRRRCVEAPGVVA